MQGLFCDMLQRWKSVQQPQICLDSKSITGQSAVRSTVCQVPCMTGRAARAAERELSDVEFKGVVGAQFVAGAKR